jgi:hypothetical protein
LWLIFAVWLVDLVFELGGLAGFGDVVVDPRLHRADDVFFVVARRQHYHRQRGRIGGVAHFLQEFETRHPGHVPVGEHKVKRLLGHMLPGLLAVFGLDHVVVSQSPHHLADDAAHHIGVFDDEHLY